MKKFIEVLMERDGMTEDEAKSEAKRARKELKQLVEEGDYLAAEEYMQEEFGLEPDYMDEFVFGMM
jgi:hypothetical protein